MAGNPRENPAISPFGPLEGSRRPPGQPRNRPPHHCTTAPLYHRAGAVTRFPGRPRADAVQRSVVEVEVTRRALLKPQTIVIRRVLEELGSLLQHVLVALGLRLGGMRNRVLRGLAATDVLHGSGRGLSGVTP